MEEGPADSDEEIELPESSQKSKRWSRIKSKVDGFRRRKSSPDAPTSSISGGDGGISDFLYSTGQPPNGKPKFQPPQIDVSAAQAADEDEQSYDSFKFSKPPRAVGLRVAFVTTAPEIIGLGGEDSEEPVNIVSSTRLSSVSNLPHNPTNSQSIWQRTTIAPVAQSHNKGLLVFPGDSRVNATPLDGRPSHGPGYGNAESERPDSMQRANAVPNRTYSQMRADEGRAFLAATLGPAKGVRRKPVTSSDSESDSRSRSPATSHQASPPPSRGSDDGVFPAAQYPKPLLPSHLQSEGWSPQKLSQPIPFRPSSSGSDSNGRGRLRRVGQTADLRSEQADVTGPKISAFPTSHPNAPSQRPDAHFSGNQAADPSNSFSLDRLVLPPGPRSRSSSNQSAEGLEDQNCLCKCHLKALVITKTSAADDASLSRAQTMPWSRIHVFAVPQEDARSENVVRVICFDSRSSLIDDYVRPLHFKLDRSRLSTIILHRPPSSSAAISISPNVRDDFLLSQLKYAQGILKDTPTTLMLNFPSRTDAHKFQEATTGYSVRFEGVAQYFAISRRRMMVSIHKSYETADAKIQVLHGHNRTFLVAFFSEYTLADCLHLELKSFDVFESSETKDGLFFVKLVDAKFSLPDPKSSHRPEFIALDSLEPASEHEDIFIGFADESVREEFSAALPAVVTGPRRFTLKRRI